VKTVSNKVVRHSLAYLSVQKWFVGGRPLKGKFFVKVNHLLVRKRIPAMRITSETERISDLQGSDTRARTQKKTRWVFLGKPTLKKPGKKPAKNRPKTIKFCMSYSTVIKKFFTRLKDVNV